MRVLCINTQPISDAGNRYLHKIKEGEVYIVEAINVLGGYILKEVPGIDQFYKPHGRITYNPSRFVVCQEENHQISKSSHHLIK